MILVKEGPYDYKTVEKCDVPEIGVPVLAHLWKTGDAVLVYGSDRRWYTPSGAKIVDNWVTHWRPPKGDYTQRASPVRQGHEGRR